MGHTNMTKPDDTDRIRAIFLHPDPRVTVADATQKLGWTSKRMKQAVRNGEIAVGGTSSGEGIELEEVVEIALSLWSVTEIEEALGARAREILPPKLRTQILRTRLPQYLIDMLQHLASAEHASLELFLSRELQDLASTRRDALARELPGFAEAFDWPRKNETRPSC